MNVAARMTSLDQLCVLVSEVGWSQFVIALPAYSTSIAGFKSIQAMPGHVLSSPVANTTLMVSLWLSASKVG